MKTKQVHYDYMLKEIAAIGIDRIKAHREYIYNDALSEGSKIKDPDKRFRWDLLFAAKLSTWLCDNVYTYADDNHIDTALRSIVKHLLTH